MEPSRFRIKDALTITGQGMVLIGRVESGVVKVAETLFVRNDWGCYPVGILGIDQFPKRSFESAGPETGEVGLIVSGLRKEQVQAGDLVTNVGWGDPTGDRSADFRTVDELCAALEKSGASERYSKLLNGITIEGLKPFFEVAPRVLARPELIEPLILGPDWRVTLVGTALAVLICSERLTAPMVEGLARGSWVAPQLAAGILSLPSENVDLSKLRAVLEGAGPASDPKHILPVFAVLEQRNDPAARAFRETDLFSALWKLDSARYYSLTWRWRGIWGIAGPHFRCGPAQ